MLYDFNDSLILEYRGRWFVWEISWDTFRPIDDVQWDGTTFVYDDRNYCSDLTDPLYGYGSELMKELCEMLGDCRHELPEEVDCLRIGNPKWFFDRHMSLSPCAPSDYASWKRMSRGRNRTCRKGPRGKKLTRRAWD
jgi:hypothetical protein